ncbi:cytochrome P450 [Streptomyces sp. NPDC003247]|uniref:cytochrome P450 n=1 Tax=Streptomyces sp. NPDC003247 TaxID=3364677 RepID=UPI0036785533
MTVSPVSPARLTDPELHAGGDPHALWRWMREHEPVHWHAPDDLPGFWSLTRYEDVSTVYRDPRAFSSAHGVLLRPTAQGADPGGGLTLALTDPPRHQQLRRLVARWFSERSARQWEEAVRRAVRAVLARAIERGESDAVHDISARLTLHLIAGLMGVPEGDREDLFRWTNEAFEAGTSLVAHHETMLYFLDLMDLRTAEPADDLVSALVHGSVDGEPLTAEEVLLNCENLVGASENARLSIAGGFLAFLEHPDQWQRLRDDRRLLPTAVEEVLRWTSSATHSMRTATAARDLGGRRIEAGDRVVLWVPSANRDEAVFPHADRFDIARRPNRHLALGTGEHVCIGNVMARAQMRVLFTELLDTVRGFEQCGPYVPVRSIAVNGPEHLPIRLLA